jgi:hypothetical protein
MPVNVGDLRLALRAAPPQSTRDPPSTARGPVNRPLTQAEENALGWVGVGALGGAVVVLLSGGIVAAVAVPVAMSAFGTVVPGTGTLQDVGGVGASMQALSAGLLTTTAVTTGAVVGGVLSHKPARDALKKAWW